MVWRYIWANSCNDYIHTINAGENIAGCIWMYISGVLYIQFKGSYIIYYF